MKRTNHFSSSYFKSKKGFATFINFSLLLLLFLAFFFGAKIYQDSKLTDLETQNKERELLERALHFRGALVSLSVANSSQMEYINNMADPEVTFTLDSSTITSAVSGSQINVSTLGISFCSNYTLYPAVATNISFNGTCVAIT